MARLDYNPDTVPEDDRDFPLIPDGLYTMQVIESDLVANKAGTGQILNLVWEVMDAPYARRKVFEGLNIRHNNQQAQDIAQRDLKKICTAVGHVGVLHDSDALHFKPLRGRIGHEEATAQFRAKNVMKGYEPLNGAAAPRSAPAAQSQPAQSQPAEQREPATAGAGGGASSRPWAK